MKLAVTGKGGVGKTTITALLARELSRIGHAVLAVDADPNATLAACLGFPDPDQIPPLDEMADLIEERTGVKPGTPGAVYRLNPQVDDLAARFAVEHDGIRLLRMGAIKTGGSGCYCPENALLKNLVSHLLLKHRDALLLDMAAGVEHLSRGTVAAVDRLLVVVIPSRQSVTTAKRICSLAADLGLTQVGVVASMCRDDRESQYVAEAVAPAPMLAAIPYDEGLRLAEFEGRPPSALSPGVARALVSLVDALSSSTRPAGS